MDLYYNTSIDRYNSSSFNYVADTNNAALLKLTQDIWEGFSEATRKEIDPPGPNSKPLGLVTLRVIVLQLFELWVTEPEVCLAIFNDFSCLFGNSQHQKLYTQNKPIRQKLSFPMFVLARKESFLLNFLR